MAKRTSTATEAVLENTEAIDSIPMETVAKTEKKKFNPTDVIECVSLVSGELGMVGLKSGINYSWFGRGEVVEVEYQDLAAAIRSGKKHITQPFFIIKDSDFIKEFPQIEKIYSAMYSLNDLKDVFKMTPASMKKTILSLPIGAQESIKNIAASMIQAGTLDSVQKIKVLDEIFDTKFMLMTELYG